MNGKTKMREISLAQFSIVFTFFTVDGCCCCCASAVIRFDSQALCVFFLVVAKKKVKCRTLLDDEGYIFIEAKWIRMLAQPSIIARYTKPSSTSSHKKEIEGKSKRSQKLIFDFF